MFATVPALVDVDDDRLLHQPGRDRPPLELADRVPDFGRIDVRRPDDDVGRDLGARERRLETVVGLHHAERLRVGVDPRLGRMEGQCGRRDEQQQPGRERGRKRRPAQDAVDDRAPNATLLVIATSTVDERHAQPLDVVAQLGQDGRQHRQ